MEMISLDAGITVMIVDDSPFMRQMLRKMLEMSGYEVVAEAENGVEAVSMYSKLCPDITFMDMLMPVKSGIDATKEILLLDKSAKIVMCSSLGTEELIKAALESGARDVALKPYKVQELSEVLQRVVLI